MVRGFVAATVPRNFRGLWERDGQVDYAYAAADVGRFRVNAFVQQGRVGMVMRVIPNQLPTIDGLALPRRRLNFKAKGAAVKTLFFLTLLFILGTKRQIRSLQKSIEGT